MQVQYTLDIFQDTEISEMSEKSKRKVCQDLTSWLEDSHVKAFLMLEREEGSMTQEELSFLKSQGFSKTKDPNIFYSKMLGVYYITIKEKLSREYLKFSPIWGIMCNGRYLTRKSSYLKTEKESLLRDILERNVEEKYYLSEEQIKNDLAVI